MPDALYPALHGRQHCPGGEDPIPCLGVQYFRAYLFDDMTGVATTMQDVTWDEDWENGAPSVFTPRTAAGATATQGVDGVRFVDLNVPGRYTFTAGLYFSASFNGSVGIMLQDQNPVLSTPYIVVHGPHTYDFGGAAALQLQGYYLFNYSRVYPLLDPFNSGDQLPVSTYFQVGQNSGSGKTISEGFLEIQYEPVVFPA